MDCGVCVYSSCDDDAAEVYSASMRKARKPYRCCECFDSIPVGAMYENVWGVWEGEASTFRTCAACVEIRNAFCCEGSTFRLLWQDFADSDAFAALTTACFEKLTTAAAKRKLQDRWIEWKHQQ